MNNEELIRQLYWESFYYDGDSLYRKAARRIEQLRDENKKLKKERENEQG